MSLQEYLVHQFVVWSPPAPQVLSKSRGSVTLDWSQLDPFQFIADQLLFTIEKNEKIPPWVQVYSGGKTTKEITNLAPRHPHRFRLRVTLKSEGVSMLASRAVQRYGCEDAVYEWVQRYITQGSEDECPLRTNSWLWSRWSDETWSSTESDGTSAECFCMAVRCGYIKQVQVMLEERPELLAVLNPVNGYTPLATAVRKGDIGTVRVLLGAGADVNQCSANGQTALHLAALGAAPHLLELLLDHGADLQARDVNGLRVEHYAVDSCDVTTLRDVIARGGDLSVTDNNGWTPLFRALCQGAETVMIEALVAGGSQTDLTDRAGLPLTSVARVITNRLGRSRDSVLRLVDVNYPHEAAVANFTRLTKKISHLHSLFNIPSLNKKPNLTN